MQADPSSRGHGDAGAGGGLLDVRVVAALALLVLNDHVFKDLARGSAWGVVTGKLSDIAGVVFLPVLIVAAVELVKRGLGRFSGPSPRGAAVVAVVVAVAFTLMKTNVAAGAIYAATMGVLQWPFFAVAAALKGDGTPAVRAVAHVVDPGDVIAVPGAFFVWWQTRRRRRG